MREAQAPETKKLKPAEGRRVRKPDGRLLADRGEDIAIDAFWQRRLEDGDVVEVEARAAPAAPAAGGKKD